MKWIVEDSLSNFPFWGGAKDTVEDLTEEQINAFGDFLEQNGSEDTVYTDTEINDMFWHDRDYVYSIVGWPGYPKVFKITHPDGRSVDVLVRSENEEQDLKGSLNVSSQKESCWMNVTFLYMQFQEFVRRFLIQMALLIITMFQNHMLSI
jgi:hypothetical protein